MRESRRTPPAGKTSAGVGAPAVAAALAALAAVPYLPWGGLGAFVNLDDNEYVFENPSVRGGLTLAGVRWAFTSFHSSNWHPVTWLSHMLDVSLFGLDPWWHHATSVAIHALATALLFLALRRMTGALWRSALVAALFAVHPLHVESVAWVAERKDVLSGLFFALVLVAYERRVRRGGAARLGAVAAAAAAGLMAKPMLVTVPFVLLLLDVWPFGRAPWGPRSAAGGRPGASWSRLLVEKLPLFGLSAASCAVTFAAQGRAQAVADMTTLTLGVRVSNALVSVAEYLRQAAWPAALAVYYPHPLEVAPPWRLAGGLLLLTGVSAAVLALARRRPCAAVGWLWFLGMLVPVIGIVQVGLQARADRYTYLPLVGVFIAAAWCLPGRAGAGRLRGALPGAGAAVLVGALTAASIVQAGFWRDEETLYRRALAVTSGNWLIGANLGSALIAKGRYAEAVDPLREALRLQPDYAKAHNSLGVALAGLGRLAESEASYRRALALIPGYAKAHYNLANALARQGRADEAIAEYERALAIAPDSSEAHFNLANLLAGEGRAAESIRHYREALRLDPEAHDAMNNLAWALAADPAVGAAQAREAVAYARRACELTGYRNPVYLDTLAAAQAAAGSFPEAVKTSGLALAAALDSGDRALAAEIAARLERYRSGEAAPPLAPAARKGEAARGER